MQYYLKKHHKNFGETEQSCSQVHLEKQTYKPKKKKNSVQDGLFKRGAKNREGRMWWQGQSEI